MGYVDLEWSDNKWLQKVFGACESLIRGPIDLVPQLTRNIIHNSKIHRAHRIKAIKIQRIFEGFLLTHKIFSFTTTKDGKEQKQKDAIRKLQNRPFLIPLYQFSIQWATS